MTSKCEQVSNSHHIDRVLVALKLHPNQWVMTYEAGWDDATFTAWQDARGTARSIAGKTVRAVTALRNVWVIAMTNVMDISNYSIYRAAEDVIIALLAYDDSGHLLDSSPEEIKLLDALGHPYAILMLPAAIAFENIGSEVL